ncbi:hypothetical protein Hte_005560 [Hypoxylon texense]
MTANASDAEQERSASHPSNQKEPHTTKQSDKNKNGTKEKEQMDTEFHIMPRNGDQLDDMGSERSCAATWGTVLEEQNDVVEDQYQPDITMDSQAPEAQVYNGETAAAPESG